MQPVITIFCAFARDTYTDKWLQDLAHFKHDQRRTRITIIIDGDFTETARKLREYFESQQYLSYGITMNHEHNPNEARINVRRARIGFVKNQSKYLIQKRQSDYVLGLEDDTEFGGMDINDLLYPFENFDGDIGMVTGLQCGRWSVKYIGAWLADNADDPKEVKSITPAKFENYLEVDAGGFYWYLTPTKLYCAHDYSWGHEQWGADVNYGLWLRQQGYRNWAHLRSVVGHRTNFNQTIYPDGTITEVRYYKDGDKWLRQDTDKESSYEFSRRW